MAMITEVEDYSAKGCGRCLRFDIPVSASGLWACAEIIRAQER